MKKITERERLRRIIASVQSRTFDFKGRIVDVQAKKRRLLGILAKGVRESQGVDLCAVWLKLGLESVTVKRFEHGSPRQDRRDIDQILGFYGWISPLTRSLIIFLVNDCFPKEGLRIVSKETSLPQDLIPRFTESLKPPRVARRFVRRNHMHRRSSASAYR